MKVFSTSTSPFFKTIIDNTIYNIDSMNEGVLVERPNRTRCGNSTRIPDFRARRTAPETSVKRSPYGPAATERTLQGLFFLQRIQAFISGGRKH